MSKNTNVGLDAHADTIAVAVAERDGERPFARHNSEPFGIDSQAGGETGAG